jgi:3-oxoacyl-[acyl-carrier-protein] synthase-1
MAPLFPVRISAWSWVGAPGAEWWIAGEPSSSPPFRTPLSELLGQPSLFCHATHLGIPGASGVCHERLASLPPELAERESRCARLLARSFAPLAETVQRACQAYGRDQVAIVLGSSTGGIDATEEALRTASEFGGFDAFDFIKVHPHDALLVVLAGLSGAEGPGYVVSTACSSSAKAIAAAQRLIQSGRARAVITGGVDSLCETTVRGFAGLGVLSNEACRPFDGERSGISIGEGAALLLLEHVGPSPFVLLGSGESSDAHHLTAPHPEGDGAEAAFRKCLQNSGLGPEQIDFVNAHGTGTLQNDLMETKAIARVFGDAVPFSSTKHRTGHLLGTAGAQEAIFCLKAFEERRVPPNLALRKVDETLALQPSTGENFKRKSDVRIALSSSFAFGGNNACLALAESSQLLPAQETALSNYPILGFAFWSPPTPEENSPPALLLPHRARGRASTLVRLFAQVVEELISEDDRKGEPLPLIFASEYGEMTTTWKLLLSLGKEATLSPLRFQASVHNTAAGIISIATENKAPSISLAAGAQSFASGITEAQAWLDCHGGEVLVAIADESLPDGLHALRPFQPAAFALRLGSRNSGGEALASVGRLVATEVRDSSALALPAQARFNELGGSAPCWALGLVHALNTRWSGSIQIGPRSSLDLTFHALSTSRSASL